MSDQYNIQPGSVFAGDYRILRALTAGGMGAVYVAEQVSTGKPRAVKVMLPALVADPALRKRFEQEARIGSMIESEHVVEVVGAGIDGPTGLPWLAMELLQGEELAKVVETRGPLPVQDVLVIFEQLCHAVGAAHRVGVVHRDLKPENVFLAQAHRAGASYMVKVLDFGIAKIVAEASTKQTAAMGSPIWMAPEQADQSPITPGTDVWALGLIAFYLLTGRPYWRSANDDNATIPQVLKEVLFEPIVPASVRTAELGTSLPLGFDAWFVRCVARDPLNRFPDATQAGAALLAALGANNIGMPVSVLAPTGFSVTPHSSYAPGSAAVPYPTGPQVAEQGYGQATPRGGTGPVNAPAAVAGTGGSYTVPAAPVAPVTPRPEPPAKRSGALVGGLVVGGLLLAGAVGGGLWWNGHHVAAASPAPTTATTTTDQTAATNADVDVVHDAKRLSDQGKYDAAHQRLAQIAAGSEARQSPEFKDIEFKWATETLLLADRTTDTSTKRGLLELVANGATVDETLRLSAKDRLATLENPDAAVTKAKVSQTTLRGLGGSKPSEGVVIVTNQPDTVAPVSTFVPVVPPPPATAAPPQKSVAELANSTAVADWWAARRILEPKLSNGTATLDEVHTLQQICRNQHDKPCLRTCARALAGKH